MMEKYKSRLFDGDGWEYALPFRLSIECLRITERIVERLGNKAEQKTTRKYFMIANNWSRARMKSSCAEKYSISDASGQLRPHYQWIGTFRGERKLNGYPINASGGLMG